MIGQLASTITADQLIENAKVAILRPLILLLFALAALLFFYGVVEFVSDPGNETRKALGKQHLLWGVVGLAIMISVYGIMNLICTTISCAG